jgi:hypothetical protein
MKTREVRITGGDASAGSVHQIASVTEDGKTVHRFAVLPGDKPEVLIASQDLALVLGVSRSVLDKTANVNGVSHPSVHMRCFGAEWPELHRMFGLDSAIAIRTRVAPDSPSLPWANMLESWLAVNAKVAPEPVVTTSPDDQPDAPPVFQYVITRVNGTSMVTYWRNGEPFWIARDIPVRRSRNYVLTILSHREHWAKDTVDGVDTATCDEAFRFYQQQEGLHVCRVNTTLMLRPGMERLALAFPEIAEHVKRATGEESWAAQSTTEPGPVAVQTQPEPEEPDNIDDLDDALDRAIERAMPRILEAVRETVKDAVANANAEAIGTLKGDVRTTIRAGALEMMRLLILSTNLKVGVPE